MNTILSPLPMILLKWTALLALGWTVHGFLRKRHPRARLVLWRSVLCFTLLVPVMQFAPFTVFRFHVSQNPVPELADVISAVPSGNAAANSKSIPGSATSLAKATIPVLKSEVRPSRATPLEISWRWLLLIIFGIGSGFAVLRLAQGQLQLNRLRNASRPANTDMQERAQGIRAALGIKREIDVRISAAAVSPFACGLIRATVILPQKLVQDLPSDEISVLLAHEIAHFRRNDLFWCVGWRWIQALFWFHPFVWKIPAAHSLACEQEADGMASSQCEDHGRYPQLLARLALRILEPPPAETRLALSAAAQVTQRLNHLERGNSGNWNWKYSAGIFGVVALLFLIATGCSTTTDTETASSPSGVKFKNVLVVVQDEDGKPIAGATILPNGFRVKGLHGADAYGWRKNIFGPPEKAVTDSEGKAYVKYPVEGIPEEKEYTGALILKITHPEFASVFVQTYMVDGSEKPIQLTRGIYLEVSGYYGSDHQPVPELVPNLNEELMKADDWQKEAGDVFSFHKLSPGSHLLQLMGRLPSGEIVYSDSFTFTAEEGKNYKFALEMKPGICVEGRLDDNVARPVKNGRVLINVRPKEFPAWNNYGDVDDLLKKYPNFRAWHSYRTIAPDGTFVFESVPPGGLDMVVWGDGFVSKDLDTFQQRNGSKLVKVPGFALPQAFSLVSPETKVEVATEPTATLELTATTKEGKPIAGATVYVNPNIVRMGGIYGNMRDSSETPFRKMDSLPYVPYSAITDNNGLAIIRNIPPTDRGIEIDDSQYQVPLQQPQGWRDRYVRTAFSPGLTNQVHMVMERKGTDFLGTVR